MSNLRQLHTAMELYSVNFKGYDLPAKAWGGSDQNYCWWGIETLGASLGVQRYLNTGADQTDTVDRIAKMIDCPSIVRERDPAGSYNYSGDYTYNTNLGDNRAEDPSDTTNYPKYHPWAFFKKRATVPGSVVVALDASAQIAKNDDRFQSVSDLTTTNSTHPYPLGGSPHRGKANILFHDGSVRLAVAYDPTKTPNTQLEDWMIRYPDTTKDSASTIENNRWKKGREVPF
jgi:prepilin-type processing-associated H-X9-DG protein